MADQQASDQAKSLIRRALLRTSSRLKGLPAQAKVGLPVLAGVLLAFLVALSLTKDAGAFAGALGSVVGGLAGAGGAVWAVYLALSRQREEDISKVASAVRVEVLHMAKYAIGGIEVCIAIANKTVTIPRSDAGGIGLNFAVEPIVYRAVADRVGLLPHPEATVGFYMRLAEAKAAVDILAKPQPVSQTTNQWVPPQMVTPENAMSIVECLATALRHAHTILADDGYPDHREQLSTMARQEIVRQIAGSLDAAKVVFPNAESFIQPSQDIE
ncbi:MAG: hypothetical protein P4M00_02765 [Azospirillaceae bacterium]|nr:hypothetical protein [Azospirillaceae bacterium]